MVVLPPVAAAHKVYHVTTNLAAADDDISEEDIVKGEGFSCSTNEGNVLTDRVCRLGGERLLPQTSRVGRSLVDLATKCCRNLC